MTRNHELFFLIVTLVFKSSAEAGHRVTSGIRDDDLTVLRGMSQNKIFQLGIQIGFIKYVAAKDQVVGPEARVGILKGRQVKGQRSKLIALAIAGQQRGHSRMMIHGFHLGTHTSAKKARQSQSTAYFQDPLTVLRQFFLHKVRSQAFRGRPKASEERGLGQALGRIAHFFKMC